MNYKIICHTCGGEKTLSGFSAVIRAKRDELKVGVRDFAKLTGVSSATISRIERIGICSIEVFQKLCIYLELDEKEVFNLVTREEK